MPTIEFISSKSIENLNFKPIPASQALPDWFSQTPVYEKNVDTIKICPGINDILRAGYIIRTNVDISVEVNALIGNSKVVNSGAYTMPSHPKEQFERCPHHNKFDAFKFKWDFYVRTPPGYSCLFLDPWLHKHPDFVISEAIIDTDTFHSVDNVIALPNKKTDFIIPKGTPIVQVVPFLREDWEHTVYTGSIQQASELSKFSSIYKDRNTSNRIPNIYHKKFHSKKAFK